MNKYIVPRFDGNELREGWFSNEVLFVIDKI